ncbi:MAG TPA: amidase [Marmoricola sp.]|jgi:aspartyl-tRNA(Asn)/glutamyl-tRNA(Gln) amidotransferase subunit A|nr:amidase [Marmoricola sp.]
MTDVAAPISDQFRRQLAALAGLDLGDIGVPGALHLGAPAESADPGQGTPLPPLRDLGQSAVAALAAAREQIAHDATTVDAWACVAETTADQEAARADRSRSLGALHGVPVGVKDVLDAVGLPTAGGSAYYSGMRARVPKADSAAVALLRRAGAVVVGKTRTHEFAMGGTTPPTRNPHDLDRIPGGSSGGSAAAVAAGHVRVALGSDTGGSVRIPAAYCGVAGLVPSPGLIPFTGGLPLAWSMDRVGVLASGPVDLAAASHALGLVADLSREPGLDGLRIGVPRGTFDGAVDPEVVDAVQQALAIAEAAGAVLVDVDVPHQGLAVTTGMTIILGEGAEEQRDRRADRPDLLGRDVLDQLAMADEITAATYVRAQRLRALLRAELLAALADVDLLATPTMPCTAPLVSEAATGGFEVGGQMTELADAHLRYNIGANLAALPAGTQPLPRDGALPIGLEWVGRPGDDGTILEAMVALEQAW